MNFEGGLYYMVTTTRHNEFAVGDDGYFHNILDTDTVYGNSNGTY